MADRLGREVGMETGAGAGELNGVCRLGSGNGDRLLVSLRFCTEVDNSVVTCCGF